MMMLVCAIQVRVLGGVLQCRTGLSMHAGPTSTSTLIIGDFNLMIDACATTHTRCRGPTVIVGTLNLRPGTGRYRPVLRGQVFTVHPSSRGRHGSIDVAIRLISRAGRTCLQPASQRGIVPHFKQIPQHQPSIVTQ